MSILTLDKFSDKGYETRLIKAAIFIKINVMIKITVLTVQLLLGITVIKVLLGMIDMLVIGTLNRTVEMTKIREALMAETFLLTCLGILGMTFIGVTIQYLLHTPTEIW